MSAHARALARHAVLAAGAALVLCSGSVQARTVWRCVVGGSVSMATAPEPGARCTAHPLDDNAVQTPNLWGSFGVFSGVLYQLQGSDGTPWYTTRKLPGAVEYLRFTVATPAASGGVAPAGKPRLGDYRAAFASAARATGVEEAWLRAIAHAESDYDPAALSPKGAQGLMQLMPDTAALYGVRDPYSAEQSIRAGARHLQQLERRYPQDRRLVAAAYNAGVGAVSQYRGVPPYPETEQYVQSVLGLYAAYREAMGLVERPAR
jgi:hypothetical protein